MSRIAAGPGQRNENPTKPVAESKLARVSYLAERFDKPESTIYAMVKAGRIPGVVRLGRTLRFKVDEIERWIEAGGDAR
jgi:excisionase family DNA binding protein